MTTASIDREWQRFTFNERLARFAAYLCFVSAIVWSWQTVEIIQSSSTTHQRSLVTCLVAWFRWITVSTLK